MWRALSSVASSLCTQPSNVVWNSLHEIVWNWCGGSGCALGVSINVYVASRNSMAARGTWARTTLTNHAPLSGDPTETACRTALGRLRDYDNDPDPDPDRDRDPDRDHDRDRDRDRDCDRDPVSASACAVPAAV